MTRTKRQPTTYLDSLQAMPIFYPSSERMPLSSTVFILLSLPLAKGFGVSSSPGLSNAATTFSFPRYQQQLPTCPRADVSLSMSIPNPFDTLTSGLASIVRMPGGVTAEKKEDKQRFTLKTLFDVENSRACRKVRERISELDMVVQTVVPSAPNSRVFSKNSDFPYSLPEGTVLPRLVVQEEEGQDVILEGEEDIIEYFDEFYPPQSSAVEEEEDKGLDEFVGLLRGVGNVAASMFRMGRGSQVSPAAALGKVPEKNLVLYSYEGNQFCRLVREVLTELDLPYELRSAGKESPRRSELAEVSGGSTQCPYFLDPNNDVAMSESADIIAYLYENYANWTPPNEVLQWVSNNVMSLAKPIFGMLAPLQAGSGDEDKTVYEESLAQAKEGIEKVTSENPVVIYTYSLSPFSSEAKTLLDNLDVEYKEVSLGAEWIPGLLEDAPTRAALQDMTGQSSLPHVFVGGESIGGLFSGSPGLVPALEQGKLLEMVATAANKRDVPKEQPLVAA